MSLANKLEYDTSLNVTSQYLSESEILRLKELTSRPLKFNECMGYVEPRRAIVARCKNCFRRCPINPSCNARYCFRCSRRRQNGLVRKFADALRHSFSGTFCQLRLHRRGVHCGGDHMIAVLLTGYRVSSLDLRANADRIMSDAGLFLKKHWKASLRCLEHTYDPITDTYFIHVHAVVVGSFKEQMDLSAEWGRFVTLSDLRWTPPDKVTGRKQMRSDLEMISAGVFYPLKYITKGVSLQVKDALSMKHLRYYRPTGGFYDMPMPIYRSFCKTCGGGIGACTEDVALQDDFDGIGSGLIDALDNYGNVIGRIREPLEVQREISYWTIGRKKRLSLRISIRKHWDELEQWFKKQIDGLQHFDSFRNSVNFLWLVSDII